jgi:hypothetical protein
MTITKLITHEIMLQSLSVQGSTKMAPVDHMINWIFVLVQKDSNAKKKFFSARNLKDCLPSLTIKRRKA